MPLTGSLRLTTSNNLIEPCRHAAPRCRVEVVAGHPVDAVRHVAAEGGLQEDEGAEHVVGRALSYTHNAGHAAEGGKESSISGRGGVRIGEARAGGGGISVVGAWPCISSCIGRTRWIGCIAIADIITVTVAAGKEQGK